MAVWTPFGTTYLTGTWEAGKPIVPAAWNTYVRDNLLWLYAQRANAQTAVPVTGTPVAVTVGRAGADASVGTAPSQASHVHATPATWPVTVLVAGTVVGTRDTINVVSGATVTDVTASATARITFPEAGIWTYGTPGTSAFGDTTLEGSSAAVARATHVHGREQTGTPTTIDGSATAALVSSRTRGVDGNTGTASTPSLADHVHATTAYWPVVWHAMAIPAVPSTSAPSYFLESRPEVEFTSGTGITVTGADDAPNARINLTFAGASTVTVLPVKANQGTAPTARSTINFVSASGVSMTASDSGPDNRVNLTISGTASAGDAGLIVATTTPTVIVASGSSGGSAGSSALLSPGLHRHAIDPMTASLSAAPVALVAGTAAGTAGGAQTVSLSRSDHRHASPDGWPVAVSLATGTGGTLVDYAQASAVSPYPQGVVQSSATLPARAGLVIATGTQGAVTTTVTDDPTNQQTVITITKPVVPGSEGYRVLIQRVQITSLTTRVSQVTFSAIPQGYTSLELKWKSATDASVDPGWVPVTLRFAASSALHSSTVITSVANPGKTNTANGGAATVSTTSTTTSASIPIGFTPTPTPVEGTTSKRHCVGTVTIPYYTRSFRPQIDATCHGKWLNFGYVNTNGTNRAAPDYTVLTGYITGVSSGLATMTWTAGTLRTKGYVAHPGFPSSQQVNRALAASNYQAPQNYAGTWPITGTTGTPASVSIPYPLNTSYGAAGNQLPLYWSQDIPGAVTASGSTTTAADHWFDGCEWYDYANRTAAEKEVIDRSQPVVESRRIIGRHDSAGPVTWLQVDFGANLLIGNYAELWGIP